MQTIRKVDITAVQWFITRNRYATIIKYWLERHGMNEFPNFPPSPPAGGELARAKLILTFIKYNVTVTWDAAYLL